MALVASADLCFADGKISGTIEVANTNHGDYKSSTLEFFGKNNEENGFIGPCPSQKPSYCLVVIGKSGTAIPIETYGAPDKVSNLITQNADSKHLVQIAFTNTAILEIKTLEK